MKNLAIFLLVYLLVMGFAAFILCGIDKRKAVKGLWRISEKALLVLGVLGGCFGLWAGMSLFRHKTKHLKFKLLVPAECLLWAFIVGFTLYKAIG